MEAKGRGESSECFFHRGSGFLENRDRTEPVSGPAECFVARRGFAHENRIRKTTGPVKSLAAPVGSGGAMPAFGHTYSTTW